MFFNVLLMNLSGEHSNGYQQLDKSRGDASGVDTNLMLAPTSRVPICAL